MRVWVWVLALAGCDRVFGIGDPYEDARAVGGDVSVVDGLTGDSVSDSSIDDADPRMPTLLAYYAFDDNLLDSVSGTPANASTGVGSVSSGGRRNGYILLDGTGCVWFTLAAKPAAYTISFWINPQQALQGDTMLLSRLYATSSIFRSWAFSTTATNTAFHWYNGSTEVTFSEGIASLPAQTWHHLAITYDGAKMAMFVDSSVTPVVTESQVAYGTDSTVYLGCQEGSTTVTKFAGGFDELRIYDGALTPTELAALP